MAYLAEVITDPVLASRQVFIDRGSLFDVKAVRRKDSNTDLHPIEQVGSTRCPMEALERDQKTWNGYF